MLIAQFDAQSPKYVEYSIPPQADMFDGLTKAVFESWGLQNPQLIKKFSLFVAQFLRISSADLFALQKESLRRATTDTGTLEEYVARKWDRRKNFVVYLLFENDQLFKYLYRFGISCKINPSQHIEFTKFNPIEMLDRYDLQAGDITQVTGDSIAATAIRFGTASLYAHTGMYDGAGYLYEALGDGVVATPLDKALREAGQRLAVFRSLSVGSGQRALGFIRDFSCPFPVKPKVQYNMVGAIASGTRSTRGFTILALTQPVLIPMLRGVEAANQQAFGDRYMFCSESVSEAYRLAGAPLFPGNPNRVYPGRIETSLVLKQIGYLKYLA